MPPIAFVVLLAIILPLRAFTADLQGSLKIEDRNGDTSSFYKYGLVFLEPQESTKLDLVPTDEAIATKNKTFQPEVLAVVKGSSVAFPNNDKILHNVFSVSKAKRFDLGLYRKGEGKSIVFDKSGLVNVHCNIRPNMVANILVLDYPYFSRVTPDCKYTIQNIPQGKYNAVAWYRYGDPISQEIDIDKAQNKLDWTIRHSKSTRTTHKNKHGKSYKKQY